MVFMEVPQMRAGLNDRHGYKNKRKRSPAPKPKAHANKSVHPTMLDYTAMTLYLTMRGGGKPSPKGKG
jgi:hypothetical protein